MRREFHVRFSEGLGGEFPRATRLVAGFQHRGDAHRFKAALTRRLEKFKLTLAEEKTGVHLFTRFRKRDSKRFDFPGFEYRWGRSMKGGDVVKLRTSPKRQQKSLAAFTAWVKERRNKRLRTLFWELNPKLRGYYCGIPHAGIFGGAGG